MQASLTALHRLARRKKVKHALSDSTAAAGAPPEMSEMQEAEAGSIFHTITGTVITFLTLTQIQIQIEASLPPQKIMRRPGGESGSLLFAKLIAS